MANPPDLRLPNPPKICTARTVTLPGHVQEKTRQLLRWGTPEWNDSYSRRTHVEGLFGRIKSPGKHGLAHGWTRIAGIVRTTLMLAMVVVAVNEQAVRTWRKANPENPDTGAPPTRAAPRLPTASTTRPGRTPPSRSPRTSHWRREPPNQTRSTSPPLTGRALQHAREQPRIAPQGSVTTRQAHDSLRMGR